ALRVSHPFPTRRSSDLGGRRQGSRDPRATRRHRTSRQGPEALMQLQPHELRLENIPPRDDTVLEAYAALAHLAAQYPGFRDWYRSEEHTSELQSREKLV